MAGTLPRRRAHLLALRLHSGRQSHRRHHAGQRPVRGREQKRHRLEGARSQKKKQLPSPLRQRTMSNKI